MPNLVEFVLEEVKRQRRSYKKVAVAAGFDENLLYRWSEGRPKHIDVSYVQRMLTVLGYELVPLPLGRIDCD